MTGRCRIGTSGWQYRHWRGAFYPDGLPVAEWFSYYAERFDTVEINNTFYHLPDAGTIAHWAVAAPPGFLYALKYSRYGSHRRRLRDPERHVPVFVKRVRPLGRTLGPILVQLPPHWHVDPGRLKGFLQALPTDLRWAVEFRDPDWLRAEIFDLLGHHGVALCIHDLIRDHPRILTADWTYVRFHGVDYSGWYSPPYLAARATEMARLLKAGRDVYAYFNNDIGGAAPANALALARYVARRQRAGGGRRAS